MTGRRPGGNSRGRLQVTRAVRRCDVDILWFGTHVALRHAMSRGHDNVRCAERQMTGALLAGMCV